MINAEEFINNMILVLIVLIVQIGVISAEESVDRYKIEGKVTIQGHKNPDWVSETRVIVDGGVHVGFLRPDGSFTIRDMPAGSYIVEAVSPNNLFEPVRVDISGRAKGKIRARKVNFLQNSAVVQVSYPLRFKSKEPAPFFEKREKWNIKDMLFNPMVIMMVLPLLLLLVLPRLISTADPETQKEMQSSMNMFNQSKEMPDISDWFAKNLSGFTKKKPAVKSSAKKPIIPGRRR
ncbi:ER membrane protein complex subunit 7 isoform X2 [Nematostella vectensis]|uniref:ER membrane protein complex subunit 7 isoform X2 n=1 Tax=Nematostella vectensis TaxID=45351 RepID=UPI00138FA2D1|nr:ER membrane protein complex subunit 7 isoform X2 [Nematostella vectensis]